MPTVASMFNVNLFISLATHRKELAHRQRFVEMAPDFFQTCDSHEASDSLDDFRDYLPSDGMAEDTWDRLMEVRDKWPIPNRCEVHTG